MPSRLASAGFRTSMVAILEWLTFAVIVVAALGLFFAS
jgi:hypothetical protein